MSTTPTDRRTVHVEVDGPVALVTLDVPDEGNAMTLELVTELYDALAALAADPGVRATVLTGRDPGFCSGGSPREMLEGVSAAQPAERMLLAEQAVRAVHRVIAEIRRTPRPVIAAWNGAALGVGVGLALACDARIASEKARLMFGYERLAASPDAGTSWFLPRLVGEARALSLLWDDAVLRPARLLELGLVSQVVPHDELLPAAMKLARRLAGRSPGTVRDIKALVHASLDASLEDHLRHEEHRFASAVTRPHYLEGLTAYFEGRDPDFESEDA